MAEVATCPECGAELAAGAPEAPCPACLMKLGMQSWTARRERSDGTGGAEPTAALTHGFQAPSPAELAPRFPQLEILELRGQGGMGAVYKARQKSLDRWVALKIIHPAAADDPGFAGRFQREARALARLNHPHIVGIHDFGEADGLYYFVMEYVDGVDLRTLIADGKLQPAEALALVPQICDALQYAHEEGIVHRDIKPENILVDKRGRVKIADFGLAKMLRRSVLELTLTQSRQVVGTFHYMAPEQLERPGEVDHRADLYALGVVFYEMLTGTLPVGRFDLPSQRCPVDARLDQVVLRALEREPALRYQHASEMKTDVESVDAHSHRPPQRVAGAKAPVGSLMVDLEEARENLAMPAIGLMVYGGLALTATAALFVIYSVVALTAPWLSEEEALIVLGLITGGGLLGSVVLATGVKMRNLDNYDFVVAGSIVALLTAFSMFTTVIALPLGVWALWLLRQSDVRRAFALQRRLWRDDPAMAARLAVKRKVAGPAWGLVATGVVAMVAPVFVVLPLGREYVDDLGWLFVGALPGLLVVSGGLAMQRLGSYELAMAGIAAALLPCGPLWLIALPLGLAALALLRKPQVKAQFDRWSEESASVAPPWEQSPRSRAAPPQPTTAAQPHPSDRVPDLSHAQSSAHTADSAGSDVDFESARRLVNGPMLSLLAAGLLSFFCGLAGVTVVLIDTLASSALDELVIWAVVLHGILVGLTSPVIILGGVQLKQLESRWLGMTAAVLALLPLNPAWLIGLPAGIWTLIVLNRRDVERAFRERQPIWEDWEHALGKAAALLKAAVVFHVLIAAALWIYYVIEPPWSGEWWEVTIFLSVLTGAIVVASGTMVYGATHMRRVQSRGWALAASVAALLPVSPAVLLGLPAGLYALALLTRPGVREWFATPSEKPPPEVAAQP